MILAIGMGPNVVLRYASNPLDATVGLTFIENKI